MSDKKAFEPDLDAAVFGRDIRRASWMEVCRDKELGDSGLATRPPTSKKPILLGVSGSADGLTGSCN